MSDEIPTKELEAKKTMATGGSNEFAQKSENKTAIEALAPQTTIVHKQKKNLFNLRTFLQEHSEKITAIGTTILAVATFFLWKATQDLVNGADNTAVLQLRAYVSPEIRGWRGLSGNRPLATQITLLNYGQTPAKDVRLSGLITILPYPLPKGYELPSLKRPPQALTVFPRQTNNAPTGWLTAEQPFNSDEINEIMSEKSSRRAYMLGKITYRDFFDKLRETSFRSILDPKSIQRDATGKILTFIWTPTEDGNDCN